MDREAIFIRNVPGVREILTKSTIAIAGCGGLGSNAAVALTRAGIGKLIIADYDVVELSNLNRQYFFLADVGKNKTDALLEHLLAINPDLVVEKHFIELTPANVCNLFSGADILIEAFDKAERKAWLIETWCTYFPHKPVICASGLSGYGNTGTLTVRRSGNIVMCGDFETDMSIGLTSSRVAIVANMQANEAIEILVKGIKK
ncbi:MAG TPA: sulfur carrier protein ThiS adenylyltransferase ThiF [Candidatus Deferrimicrobium sp.]|nr:sulfur carrier protein ThiS adenylyltransferase ThiF [Candidatus Deferrimicrobium sp.]